MHSARLLGITITDTLKFDEHVVNLLSQCSQRIYMMKQLKNQGLPLNKLDEVFTALILSKFRYALPAWGGLRHKHPVYAKESTLFSKEPIIANSAESSMILMNYCDMMTKLCLIKFSALFIVYITCYRRNKQCNIASETEATT